MLLLFCLILAFFDMEKSKSFQPIHLTLMYMGLIYGGIFPLAIKNANEGIFENGQFITKMIDYTPLYTVASFLGVIGIYAGWRNVSHKKISHFTNYFNTSTAKSLTTCFYIMIIISIATQYLYTRDYGGFIGFLEINRFVRSGATYYYTLSQFSYLLPFGGFSIIAFYGFFGLFLSGKRNLLIVIGMMLSGALAAYFVLASAGRVTILAPIAIILFSILLNSRNSRRSLFFLSLFSAPLALLSFYLLSNFLDLKGAQNAEEYLLRETSYIFVSFFAQLGQGEHFHLFKDVFLSPAYLLPERITYSWLKDASVINTILIYGGEKGEFGITGGVPTDLLTFGLMQLHLLGVIIYSFIIGYALRLATCLSTSFKFRGLSCVFLSYVMIRLGIFGVFYAFPKHIITENFAAIVALLFVWGIRTLKKSRSVYTQKQ